MTDYQPSTDEVRWAYGDARCRDPDDPAHARGCPQDREFDRWLSELIRKEREEAWAEGQDSCSDQYPWEDNPYRKE